MCRITPLNGWHNPSKGVTRLHKDSNYAHKGVTRLHKDSNDAHKGVTRPNKDSNDAHKGVTRLHKDSNHAPKWHPRSHLSPLVGLVHPFKGVILHIDDYTIVL